jgi:hypothetical protein
MNPDCALPVDFFSHLSWLDGRPLLDTVDPYRRQIFTEALWTLRPDGRLKYNLVLAGRGKKNWKSADLVLAAFYRLLVWPSAAGSDVFLLANDEGQASDDLKLAKKLVDANPLLAAELIVTKREMERRDGRGTMAILPAKDVHGAHGKTYSMVGFDEIHGYRTWDLFEALAPDPTRPDALTWITSYDTLFSMPGVPLFDLKKAGMEGSDPRMLFSWYSGDFCTDPAFAELPPEQRANPSMGSWPEGAAYLEQQRRRLPTHRYRRLRLNLGGSPEGAFLNAGAVMACVRTGRRWLPPVEDTRYAAFVDMSGGSSDDAALAIGHREGQRIVVDLAAKQHGRPPFNPRDAVKYFVTLLERYGVRAVTGDRYAGETFRADFAEHDIAYRVSPLSKSDLYEEAEPRLNAGEVELPDDDEVLMQMLGLVMRGSRVDHLPGAHDDLANALCGVVWALGEMVDCEDAPVMAGSLPEIYTMLGPDEPLDWWR